MQPSLPNVAPMTEHERLTKEKETIGFYISGHPLEPFRAECELLATLPVASLGTWSDQPASLAVVVTAIRKQLSKKSGNEFARLTVEDFSGSGEVLVFPEAWAAIHDRVQADVPVLIKGGYSRRDQGADSATFIVESVTRLAELRTQGQISVSLDLAESASLPELVMRDVRAVVDAHPGAAPLEVCVERRRRFARQAAVRIAEAVPRVRRAARAARAARARMRAPRARELTWVLPPGIREAARRSGDGRSRICASWPPNARSASTRRSRRSRRSWASCASRSTRTSRRSSACRSRAARAGRSRSTTSASPSPTGSSCTATARIATIPRSSAAGRASTGRRSWSSASSAAATPRRISTATSGCRIRRATARRSG